MLKTLSVVIPTYRRSQRLPHLLDSLGRQTTRPDEIWIIDQNADQCAPEWFAEYAAHLPLKIHFQPEPNASAARNVGFSLSTGDVVLFVDDDLIAGEGFCELAMQRLRRHPQEVRCLCASVVVDGRVCCTEMIDLQRPAPAEGLAEMYTAITAAVFFERQYFRQAGGFDELLFRFARTAEDQEFFLRMRRKGMSVWIDQTLLIDHDDNVPGGCELRTGDYWKSRERCIKSWAFRYRIHGQRNGHLSPGDFFQLLRSAVLHRSALIKGPRSILRNAALLWRAIWESWHAVRPVLHNYQAVQTINHLSDSEML